jgi:putative transcriptional regulator
MSAAARLRTLVLAVVLAASTVAGDPAEASRRSLAGRLLVATDTMGDPRFARTVVYVVRHDAGGALGLIVNLPIAEVPFERVLRSYGLDTPPGAGRVRVHYGGPVAETRAFVLHSPDWKAAGTTVVDDDFALTGEPSVLQAMAGGTGPRRALFCLGHAGWAPGQLDAELETGAWAVARADTHLVFDEDPGQKWIEAMTRRILEL